MNSGERDKPLALPRRDLFILPLIVVLTVVFMWAGTEWVTRVYWSEVPNDRCMTSDPVMGSHARASCTARVKAAEGPWAEDQWNECGLRATGSCLSKVADSLRVVVIGSSTSWGYLVPFQDTWLAHAADALHRRCRRPVDIQSFGGIATLYQNAARLPQVLALRPDVVVLVLSPFDLAEVPTERFDPSLVNTPKAAKSVATGGMALPSVRDLISSSRAFLVAQHYLYQNSDLYIAGYLHSADKADYLRPPFSALWRARLKFISDDLAYMVARLRPTGIPLALILAPQQAQAELASKSSLPAGIDPYALGAALERIANDQGVEFADASKAFSHISRPQDMFYNVNGHFNGAGQSVLGGVTADTLALTKTRQGQSLCSESTPVLTR